MRTRAVVFIVFMLFSFILLLAACGKEAPLSPKSPSGKQLTLEKHRGIRLTFSNDYSNPEIIVDPGTVWVDEDGVLHIRGQVFSGAPITGDLVGFDTHNVFNLDLDLATGNGKAYGTFHDEVTWVDRNISGVFAGTYVARIESGLLSGTYKGEGSGGFEGLIIFGRQQETSPGSLVLDLTGTIIEHVN